MFQVVEDEVVMKLASLVKLIERRNAWSRAAPDRTLVYGPSNAPVLWVELHESGKLVATGYGCTHEDALGEALTIVEVPRFEVRVN